MGKMEWCLCLGRIECQLKDIGQFLKCQGEFILYIRVWFLVYVYVSKTLGLIGWGGVVQKVVLRKWVYYYLGFFFYVLGKKGIIFRKVCCILYFFKFERLILVIVVCQELC